VSGRSPGMAKRSQSVILRQFSQAFLHFSRVLKEYFCSEINDYILLQEDLITKLHPNECTSFKKCFARHIEFISLFISLSSQNPQMIES
jgi:hypothetical protein